MRIHKKCNFNFGAGVTLLTISLLAIAFEIAIQTNLAKTQMGVQSSKILHLGSLFCAVLFLVIGIYLLYMQKKQDVSRELSPCPTTPSVLPDAKNYGTNNIDDGRMSPSTFTLNPLCDTLDTERNLREKPNEKLIGVRKGDKDDRDSFVTVSFSSSNR